MSRASITVDDREVRAMLRSTRGDIKKAMLAAMNDSTALLLRDLKTYPPKPPSSSYRRTRTLARSWNRTFDDQRGEVGSNGFMAPYNRVVQDDERQARVHKGRWKTVQSVAANRKTQIARFFRERLRQYVK